MEGFRLPRPNCKWNMGTSQSWKMGLQREVGLVWLFLSGGFVSIVAHRNKPDHLLVRSRNMAHLKSLFPNAKHFSLEQADYPHRAVIDRTVVAKMIGDYVLNMKYDNFKNSISESNYFHVCHDVWSMMYEYGIPLRSVK